jgi:GNAT superfamily N-acetyltransferase
MHELSLGWRTDLAVLRLSGAQITRMEDHVLVVSPQNPGFHWGNFILVTSTVLAGSPAECLKAFEAHFPQAQYVAIGLPGKPSRSDWVPYGVEAEEVLVSPTVPRQTALQSGYEVRQLVGDRDWGLYRENQLADRPADVAPEGYARFVADTVTARRRLVRDGHGAFFGAFHGDMLAADLGIVLCPDGSARFQSVFTSPAHRRRGLASHLLAVAAAWAGSRGARQWVILAESGSDAARLYRSCGFTFQGELCYQVYGGRAGAPDPTRG